VRRYPKGGRGGGGRPPRVLFLGNQFSVSMGTYRGVSEVIAAELQREGWAVHASSGKQSRLFRAFDLFWTILARSNQTDVAVLDVFSGRAFWWASVCSRLLVLHRIPFVAVLHGGALPKLAARAPGRVQRVLRRAARVCAPSRYLKAELAHLSIEIEVVPNSLVIERYEFRARRTPSPKLVWLRAFSEGYDPLLAIQVLQELRGSYPNAELLMVGPDKGDGTFQRCVNLVERQELSSFIRIVPGVPKVEVPEVLAGRDIFLNTTTVDNTPISVIEAMACGLCIVSTNVGGLPYLMTEGYDALLVPSGDSKRMAEAVLRVLEDPDLSERLSVNARKTVEGFDLRVVMDRWKAILRGIGQPDGGEL